MKRFVYIPNGVITNGEIPKEALTLSQESQLPIREGCSDDGIAIAGVSIVSFPEVNIFDCQEFSRVNYVHCIDATNEFVTFSSDTFMEVFDKNGKREVFKPSLREKHVVKFRSRYSTEGLKFYNIYSNGLKIYSGEFEIK